MALGGALGLGLGARDARDAAPLLRGRRGTNSHPPSFHVAGVAQPHIYRRLTHMALGGSAWTWLAGVALMALGGALGLGLGARDARDAAPLLRGRRGTNSHPPSFHVAGMAQPHIYRRFAWQVWYTWHWVARLDLV